MAKVRAYWRLMRFDRPVGILLLLWPTAWAVWVASDGHPSISIACVFLAGVVLMRALGCVANDLCDRKLDGHVKRTQSRPLPAGDLTTREGIYCLLVLLILAGALACLFLLIGTLLLAVVGLVLALCYPLAKRVMGYPQLVLGMAFAWAVPMAFWQISHALPPIAWLLFSTSLLWTFIYDTQYAWVDADDDRKIGIRSSALSMGQASFLVIRIGQGVVALGWLLLGYYLHLSWFYYACLLLAVGVFFYQDRCVAGHTRAGYFSAFLSNNWAGCLVFIGLIGTLSI